MKNKSLKVASVVLDNETYDWLKKRSEQTLLSMSWMIRDLIKQEMRRSKKKKDNSIRKEST
jgi:hypothetical protein